MKVKWYGNTLPFFQLAAQWWDEASPTIECLSLEANWSRGSLTVYRSESYNPEPVLEKLGISMQVNHPAKSIHRLPWHSLKALKFCTAVGNFAGPPNSELQASASDVADLLARCTNLRYLCLDLEPLHTTGSLADLSVLRDLCCRYKVAGGKTTEAQGPGPRLFDGPESMRRAG